MTAECAVAAIEQALLFMSNPLLSSVASGLAGGLLASIVSLAVAIMQIRSNNRITARQIEATSAATENQIAALIKTNEDNINSAHIRMKEEMADRDRQYKREREDFIHNINYEERKKICSDFLSEMNPVNISNSKLDVIEVKKKLTLIQIFCNDEYFREASSLLDFFIREEHTSPNMLRINDTLRIPFNLACDLPEYKQRYQSLVTKTFYYLDRTRSGN